MVKNPPALLLAAGDYIHVDTLTDGEREEISVDRLEVLDAVHSARILKHDPYGRMEL